MNTALYKRQVVTIDSRNRTGYDVRAQVWTPSVMYGIGQPVYVVATGYICLVAHTASDVFQNDLALGYWRQTNIPSASNYKIQFPAVRNVKAMRLVSSEIPNSQYVINHNNRFLDISDATYGVDTAVLTMGTYTTATLADEMNRAINVVKGGGAPGSVYSVTYATTTQRFIITNVTPEPFALLFKTGPYGTDLRNLNCASIIGFTPGLDVSSGLAFVLRSTNVINIAGENFCYLVLKNYGAIVTSSKVVDVFAKVVWNVVPRNITFDSFVTNALIFQNSRDVIDNFEVGFINNDGTYYDFNNIDHSFSVEFFCE